MVACGLEIEMQEMFMDVIARFYYYLVNIAKRRFRSEEGYGRDKRWWPEIVRWERMLTETRLGQAFRTGGES